MKGRLWRLGGLLRARRVAAGLTQAEVARRLDVTPEYVGMAEAGLRWIHLDKIPLLAEALGIRGGELERLALWEYAPRLYAALLGDPPDAGRD